MNQSMNQIADQKTELKHHKTFCRICGCFCGLDVTTDGEKIIKVEPDKTHPYSWRDFCSKAGNAGNLRDHPKRLKTPMKRVGDKYVATSWEQAIAEIAAELDKIRQAHGPNAISTYIGNPGLSNSTGAMFQGGFLAGIGSVNNFTVGSVDQNSYNLIADKMYGCEMACLNIDVDNTQCFLFVGMNPAVSTLGWMYFSPTGWKRVLDAQKKGADLIIVDPRQTPSTKKANTHVYVKPGEDWALLLGIIKVIFDEGWQNESDCSDATGVDVIRELSVKASLEDLSARCQVTVEQIKDIAQRFATAETAACLTQTGVSQTRNGTLGHWLGHVLNLITGRIDRKGGLYYQPGIFKNTMKFLNQMSPKVERKSRIGGYPSIAGGYPLAILPEEITTPGEEQIRALIINAGNPVISGPDGQKLDAALKELDLLVAIDFFQRESHRHAHWLIPAPHFLERDDTLALAAVVLEQPFIQLGQAVIDPIDGVKHEWEFFLDLALAMDVPFMKIPGLNGLVKVSRKVARLTGNSRHAFNPRWMWAFFVKMFGVVKWKEMVKNPQGFFFAEKKFGQFRPLLQTDDGKIHAAPGEFVELLKARLNEIPASNNTQYPLQIVNARRTSMMNSWLVETNFHRKEFGDFIEINPTDAAALGILDGQRVKVSSDIASIETKASITDEVPAGIVSIDHGWGSGLYDPETGETLEFHGVNRNALVSGAVIDEMAGTPNLNGTYVGVAAL